MSAYWIARAKMADREGFRRYGELVQKAAKLYPYEVLARAGDYQVLEGEDGSDRFALLRFGTMNEALTYYNSPEYLEAAAIRRAASDSGTLVITEGLS